VPLKTLALGGLVVGALDLLDAVVFFGLRSGVRPARIFQSIAAGLLGRAAFSGGSKTAVLGVFLHFLIAFLIVCTYYALSRYIPFMTAHVVVSGILFGIGAYFVMNYVVIPLSATSRGAFVWPVVINGLAIHAFGIGVPAAWFVARAGR
jgi:uncharacterized membrane protein YagU involved in acid resistance